MSTNIIKNNSNSSKKLQSSMNKDNKTNETPSRKALNNIYNAFFEYNNKSSSNLELEVKFGTKGIRQLTKIDYDNVVRKLKSIGFQTYNDAGTYMLRIYNEYLDKNTGRYQDSNIRTEISGLNIIQEYCKSNDIKEIIKMNPTAVSFLKKTNSMIEITKEKGMQPERLKVPNADFDDLNFRVTLSGEKELKYGASNRSIQPLIDEWSTMKKTFRYINRVSFYHPTYAVVIDMSIVKTSTKKDGRPIKTLKTEDSGVFTNPETYDIEVELKNDEFWRKIYSNNININDREKVIEYLDFTIKENVTFILGGLQGTNYPLPYKNLTKILYDYLRVIHGDKLNPDKKINNSDFIGPSSVTLQKENIMPINENTLDKSKNIRSNYVVTEKADGQRVLMFVDPYGQIYFIDMNMNVMYTGAKTEEKDLKNSIIDGELILHNKYGDYINLFMAFDIYFVNSQDCRPYPFLTLSLNEEDKKKRYRYNLLKSFIKNLNPKSALGDEMSPVRIGYKKFLPKSSDNTIFAACNHILKEVEDGMSYEYETDGLIFTPISFGVGCNQEGHAGPLRKITWEHSFKWKPSKYNTIDFLVTTKKGNNGLDMVTPLFENGIDTNAVASFTQYKTLILKVSFDEKKDMFINPCLDIIEDRLPEYEEKDIKKKGSNPCIDEYETKGDRKKSKRLPVQFYPTSPYDPHAGICKIVLKPDPLGSLQMVTEETNEVFEDNTIVEFRYDITKEQQWRWIPIRVRYDKTSELKKGLMGIGNPNYGNAYNVANSNWKSIHNEITEYMIRTGAGIPDTILDEDIYYNRDANNSEKKTLAMRDFHRLYVKDLLITHVCKKGDKLIDFGCGKAGDLPRWIKANLSFVFGIDKFKDNLENRLDGACSRYLNKRREFKNMPYALFVNGNCAYNVKSGQAMLDEKAKQITKAIFGEGVRDEASLGAGVVRQYGKGIEGFNVSSVQFALHYFAETLTTMQNFIRNVAECTALNGYFIGTSYDGKLVFDMLKNVNPGESIEIVEDGIKIWEIRKDYDKKVFNDDSTSLNYQISVYQDSINQMIPEYLVNYDYFNRLMEDYGFTLIDRDEAKKMGLPEGSGLFSELFTHMMDQIKRDKRKINDYNQAPNMTEYEKKISFLNRYFVYKKIRSVNAEKVELENIDETEEQIILDKKETKKAVKIAKSAIKETKPKAVSLKKTLVLSSDEPEEKTEKMISETLKEETNQLETEEPITVKKTKTNKTTKPKTEKTKATKTATKTAKKIIIEEDDDED